MHPPWGRFAEAKLDVAELCYNLIAMKNALVVLVDDEMGIIISHTVPYDLPYPEMVERAQKETKFYASRILIIVSEEDGPKVVYDDYVSEEEE